MRKEATLEKVVQEIRRKTRRKFSVEEKIRIVLEGLRGEESIATLCRKEGLAPNLYYRWSKEFLDAGKKRLVGDTSRDYVIATSSNTWTLASRRCSATRESRATTVARSDTRRSHPWRLPR